MPNLIKLVKYTKLNVQTIWALWGSDSRWHHADLRGQDGTKKKKEKEKARPKYHHTDAELAVPE